MVLIEQISALMDFLENHQDLALGYCSRTSEGRSLSKRYWVECAQILNSVSVDCPNKTPAEWRTPTTMLPAVGASSSTSTNFQVENNSFSLLDNYEVPATVVIDELVENIQTQEISFEQENLEGRPSSINPPPKRRHRQKSARRYAPEDRDHAALESAQSRLDAIEARNAEATLKQAEATNNLAAAIDRLSSTTEKIVDLIGHLVSYVPKKKLRRIISPSDSESD